jgi:hypothetical protein
MNKNYLFTVLSKSGIKFYVEASNTSEAEQRARHPAIQRELISMINAAISEIESVEPYRGPTHRVAEKAVFRDDIFRPNKITV